MNGEVSSDKWSLLRYDDNNDTLIIIAEAGGGRGCPQDDVGYYGAQVWPKEKSRVKEGTTDRQTVRQAD